MSPENVDLSLVGREEKLIASLLHERAYAHSVDNIRLLETHISWVILTGRFAYKIKKPIKLEFLDFSSLERRKRACDDELRLNRRWAPQLYLDVVPICGSFAKPVVGGSGPPIEYAVKMQQFPQVMQLDAQLNAGLLTGADMIELAEMIAAQHGAARVIEPLDGDSTIESVQHPMLENIDHLQELLGPDDMRGLAWWTHRNLQDLQATLMQRREDGFVRECHGDLHLRNLVRLVSGIVAFDCVEFSAKLRNIDVISDVSFLVMDLVSRNRADLAYLFINRYLECSGDYAGMSVFGLYYVYHALIRAKVAAIRSLERTSATDRQHDLDDVAHCCAVARNWTESGRPVLIVMHGFAGSGKTTLSQALLSRLPAIRVRSDIERKREYGLAESERSGTGVGEGIYDPRAQTRIYEILATAAEVSLRLGQHVIVDAAFLNRADRQHFHDLAKRVNVDFIIVDTCAEPGELLQRVRIRQRQASDASEAGEKVLRYQYENAEPLDAEEREWTITVATNAGIDVGDVIAQIGSTRR